jgi:DNA-binding MarR family transcriptional regulator
VRDVAEHLRALIVASDDYRRTMAGGLDVSTTEAAVLGQLLHEGPLTPVLISRGTGLTAGSTTTLVDRLVSAGLVARAPHPGDGRRVFVELTGRGRSAIETMFGLFAADLDAAVRRVEPRLAGDPELRRRLTEVLHEFATSLRTRAEDRSGVRVALDAARPDGPRAGADEGVG